MKTTTEKRNKYVADQTANLTEKIKAKDIVIQGLKMSLREHQEIIAAQRDEITALKNKILGLTSNN